MKLSCVDLRVEDFRWHVAGQGRRLQRDAAVVRVEKRLRCVFNGQRLGGGSRCVDERVNRGGIFEDAAQRSVGVGRRAEVAEVGLETGSGAVEAHINFQHPAIGVGGRGDRKAVGQAVNVHAGSRVIGAEGRRAIGPTEGGEVV